MGHKCPAGLQCLNGYLAVVLAVAIYKATLTWNIKNHMCTPRDAELLCLFNNKAAIDFGGHVASLNMAERPRIT